MTSPLVQANIASALSMLRAGQLDHQKVLSQISTGKAVHTASDNASYWSIAQTLDSHTRSLAATQDVIGMSQAMADIATMGLKSAGGLVNEIRNRLGQAFATVPGRDAIQSEIGQLKNQIASVTSSASFAGQNWLELGETESPAVTELVAGMTDSDQGPQFVTVNHDTATSALISRNNAADGILTRAYQVTTPAGLSKTFHLMDPAPSAPPSGSREIAVDANTTPDDLGGMLKATTRMLDEIAMAIVSTGTTSNRLEGQDSYLAALQDTLKAGVGKLVDGDLEEQVVKLKATELQFKLQVTTINIMNENAKTVLDLFR